MGLAKDIVKDVATGVMVGLIIGDEETVFLISTIWGKVAIWNREPTRGNVSQAL